jgi:hypothetical protein
MPAASVTKMIGAITILIALMKASASGFIAAPVAGQSAPISTPRVIPISTCT